MFARWSIRNKLLLGMGLLLAIVAALSLGGFRGVYAYRSLVRGLSGRAMELPPAARFAHEVSNLRVAVGELRGSLVRQEEGDSLQKQWNLCRQALQGAEEALKGYRHQLGDNRPQESQINESSQEWSTLGKIDLALARLRIVKDPICPSAAALDAIFPRLAELQDLARELPSFLHARLHDIASEVRTEYRTLIILTWITLMLGLLLLAVFLKLGYSWVFRPLGSLVRGSRRVAAGEFGFRITLDAHDEMAELAEAFNQMTARFQAVRDDLDRQVRERTKQVVRSEQLASVGFLAAGVAHEINNPLASIAMCAESLEARVAEALSARGEPAGEEEVIHQYLRMIQSEAFRCKEITTRLLDFSRLGEVRRQETDLAELIEGVIEIARHLGRYQDKHVEFVRLAPVVAAVNPQEIKQVVLNLLANALDSLSAGGVARVELTQGDGQAEMIFTDDGCGMTGEVLEHLFEPFFTRRRAGQGIGLGLSITYRIIADHGGSIEAHSDGPDRGSRFRVRIPLGETNQEVHHRSQAA